MQKTNLELKATPIPITHRIGFASTYRSKTSYIIIGKSLKNRNNWGFLTRDFFSIRLKIKLIKYCIAQVSIAKNILWLGAYLYTIIGTNPPTSLVEKLDINLLNFSNFDSIYSPFRPISYV